MTPNPEPTVEERQQIIDAISLRAFYLWEAAGRPEGHTDDFWFQAEQELHGTAQG